MLIFYSIFFTGAIAAILLGCAVGCLGGLRAGVLTFFGVASAFLSIFLMISLVDLAFYRILLSLLHPGVGV